MTLFARGSDVFKEPRETSEMSTKNCHKWECHRGDEVCNISGLEINILLPFTWYNSPNCSWRTRYEWCVCEVGTTLPDWGMKRETVRYVCILNRCLPFLLDLSYACAHISPSVSEMEEIYICQWGWGRGGGCTPGGVHVAYLVFTRMPSKSYRRRLEFFLLCLCDVFRALINSLVYWFCHFWNCAQAQPSDWCCHREWNFDDDVGLTAFWRRADTDIRDNMKLASAPVVYALKTQTDK